ncbi:C40 family peptidase [Fredinandcohnia humi]
MKKILSLFAAITITTVLVGNHSASAAGQGEAVVEIGKQYIGVPYQFGGTTPSGFDCSGFLGYVFDRLNVSLPRTAADQFASGESVEKHNLAVGDLVFFTTYKPGASHAGIYVGNDRFVHASTSDGVTISSLNEPYWKPRYLGAKRYLPNESQSKLSVKEGQIGEIEVTKAINLWKRTDNGALEYVRVLKPGEVYRVYSYDDNYGGQYGLGAGLYITKMDTHIQYLSLSEINKN